MILDLIEYDYYDDTKRPLYILRPEEYKKDKKYKVIYFFDGMSTFEKSEYTNKSWNVEEAFETADMKDWIAVGIESAGKYRLNEYLPYSIEHHGKVLESREDTFDKFVIDEILPFIENNYPVSNRAEDRALVGSSMGGFITAAYAGKHADKFSSYGIFSLASWITHDNKFIEWLDNYNLNKDSKYYIYVGDKEGYNKEFDIETTKVSKAYLDEAEKFIKYLDSKEIEYKYVVGKNQHHSEESWAKYLPDFLAYIK